MSGKPFLLRAEQVASKLRDGIQSGIWKKEMPGRNALAKELGVNHKTVESALKLLEKEGFLERQGRGRGRKIIRTKGQERQQLLIMILLYEENDLKENYIVELAHQLQVAGHITKFATKTMQSLGMQPERIERYVKNTEADAWIVLAAAEAVLDWFAEQDRPAFALFGRMTNSNIAGTAPMKWPSYQQFIQRLVELGHKRITMLVRPERRKPEPGALEQYFLDQLAEHGIQTGSFNLPDWEDSPEGLHNCLDSLFQLTPPTALILSQPNFLLAAQQHLARKGILSPRDVSLICSDDSPSFFWYRPEIAHITWDLDPIIRRVVRWADDVGRGVHKRTQTFTEAKFVEGGTIGSVPLESR